MAKSKKAPESKLLEAIKFVSLAQSKSGTEMNTHCRLTSYGAIAFNGIIAAGHATDLDIEACPQTDLLLLALERSSNQCALVMLENRLDVRSGNFQAFVPCCDLTRLPQVKPDAAVMEISDKLTAALRLLLPVTSEKAENLLNATIQVRAGSAIATDNSCLIESWHGYELPTMLLPRSAAQAIVKAKRPLTAFGYSGDTATFWFGNEAWIKTRLFPDKIVDVRSIVEHDVELEDIPFGLFEAMKQVAPFSMDGRILVEGSVVSSHVTMNTGGKLEHINAELPYRVYVYSKIKIVSAFAKQMDITSVKYKSFFYGDGVRAVIAHVEKPAPVAICQGVRTTEVTDDDIPY